jgi:hypothetical protein
MAAMAWAAVGARAVTVMFSEDAADWVTAEIVEMNYERLTPQFIYVVTVRFYAKDIEDSETTSSFLRTTSSISLTPFATTHK